MFKTNKRLRRELAELQDDYERVREQAVAYAKQVVRLNDENASLTGALLTAHSKNANLLVYNNSLQQQLDTAKRVFGEAFLKGDTRIGPDRPNRKKLDKREVKDIREAFRGGMKQKDLAENYGVNPATISRIVRGVYH